MGVFVLEGYLNIFYCLPDYFYPADNSILLQFFVCERLLRKPSREFFNLTDVLKDMVDKKKRVFAIHNILTSSLKILSLRWGFNPL